MNKLFFAVLVLLTLPLYAQDEASLELSEEGLETNPLENADQSVESPVVEMETESETAPSEVTETTEETVAPADTEEKVETAETEGSAVDEFVPPANAEAVANLPEHKLEEEIDTRKKFNPKESHWLFNFGFEGMEYGVPFEYVGEKQKFEAEKRKLYGGRLGFGGEVYLGGGFMMSTRIEGYYMGTLFEKAKTADPTVPDEDVATIKDAGQIYGADAVQSLSYLWDFKTKNPFMDEWAYLTVEPFIEAGVGRAWAFNKKDYNYNTAPEVKEEYDQSFTDDLTNVRIGAGINLTSSGGFFFYLRATQNRYDITKRKTKGYYYRDGETTKTEVDANPSTNLDPIMVYSLGGGYKF